MVNTVASPRLPAISVYFSFIVLPFCTIAPDASSHLLLIFRVKLSYHNLCLHFPMSHIPLLIMWSEVKSLSHVRLFVTPWTVAHQGSLSMGFFQARVLEWMAISFSRGYSQSGIKPRSPVLQADTLPSEPPGKPQ